MFGAPSNAPAIFGFDAPTVAAFGSGAASVMQAVPGPVVTMLLAGQAYLNVSTAAMPSGELRGQIAFDGTAVAVMSAAQSVAPPPPPTGVGAGAAYPNATGQLVSEFGPATRAWGVASAYFDGTNVALSLSAWNLTSAVTAVHIHGLASPGASAPPLMVRFPACGAGGGLLLRDTWH